MIQTKALKRSNHQLHCIVNNINGVVLSLGFAYTMVEPTGFIKTQVRAWEP